MQYSSATTATTNPAVTLRSVGSNGGQAAAFTYDLARSVVYTRQGNPAWAGQERDGVVGIRPDDMFYSTWLDTNKIAIPQADEQQRLLVNLITLMNADKMPLPRFWYLPRGEKAVVVMSGDDHSPGYAPGGTASRLRPLQGAQPGRLRRRRVGVRPLDVVCLPDNVLTNAQAAAYVAEGFEVALHPVVASCPTTPMTEAQLSAIFDTQLGAFAARYTNVPAPVSNRNHCVYWPDWASTANVELDARNPDGRQLLPLPDRLDRLQARLHERRRLPDALRRPRRHADRRLAAEHEHERRGDDRLPDATSTRCSTTPSARTATTARSA